MHKSNKTVWVIVGLVVLAILAYWVYAATREPSEVDDLSFITNFEECANVGYPIMESFPRRCQTPDGIMYTEELNDAEVLGAEAEGNTGDDIDLDNISK